MWQTFDRLVHSFRLHSTIDIAKDQFWIELTCLVCSWYLGGFLHYTYYHQDYSSNYFLPVILLPMRLVFAIPKTEDHHSHGFSNIWDLFECKWFSGAQWGTQKYINNLTVQQFNLYIYSHIIDKLKCFLRSKWFNKKVLPADTRPQNYHYVQNGSGPQQGRFRNPNFQRIKIGPYSWSGKGDKWIGPKQTEIFKRPGVAGAVL